jgi:hypothetical protein
MAICGPLAAESAGWSNSLAGGANQQIGAGMRAMKFQQMARKIFPTWDEQAS